MIPSRHCLWILGNERTLTHGESVWEILIHDAKDRCCFFNADEDKDMAKAILEAKKELNELDELLNADSILFRNQKWKVYCFLSYTCFANQFFLPWLVLIFVSDAYFSGCF